MRRSATGRYLVGLILVLLGTMVRAQPADESPKREFRGVWIATVANIDWPSKQTMSADAQKAELVALLDQQKRNGINAVIFQVRPAADAFYAKGREPWSRFLNGKQGLGPEPFYDPLEFAITEAHKRGMELHAWFNPYRASTDLVATHFSKDHITLTHPGWFFNYDGKKHFNPGIPQVWEYIVGIIMDVVKNYDVDGIHFDDYFYPYKDQYNTPIPDTYTYTLFGKGFSDIKSWRRQNVDTLIHLLSDSIHTAKPFVKFGISPFGIWKNIKQDSLGSNTAGGSSFLEQYADSRKWVQQGWVDYIAPQIYWTFGYRLAAFENLLDWWSNNTYNRHLYVGQGAYRAAEMKYGWDDRRQIPKQVRAIRDNPRAQGSIFFSSKSITNNLGGVQDSLRFDLYKWPALLPQMLWIDKVPPKAPHLLVAKHGIGNTVALSWNPSAPGDDNEPPYGYVVYRFNEGEEVNIRNARNIVSVSFDASVTAFVDEGVRSNVRYTYAVTTLDRMKNESGPSNLSVVRF